MPSELARIRVDVPPDRHAHYREDHGRHSYYAGWLDREAAADGGRIGALGHCMSGQVAIAAVAK